MSAASSIAGRWNTDGAAIINRSNLLADEAAASDDLFTADDATGEADDAIGETDGSIREAERLSAQRQARCLNGIKVGAPEDRVYLICGYHDHTNDQARGLRQLVYPDYLYIYIDTTTNRVEDIQWTH